MNDEKNGCGCGGKVIAKHDQAGITLRRADESPNTIMVEGSKAAPFDSAQAAEIAAVMRAQATPGQSKAAESKLTPVSTPSAGGVYFLDGAGLPRPGC